MGLAFSVLLCHLCCFGLPLELTYYYFGFSMTLGVLLGVGLLLDLFCGVVMVFLFGVYVALVFAVYDTLVVDVCVLRDVEFELVV